MYVPIVVLLGKCWNLVSKPAESDPPVSARHHQICIGSHHWLKLQTAGVWEGLSCSGLWPDYRKPSSNHDGCATAISRLLSYGGKRALGHKAAEPQHWSDYTSGWCPSIATWRRER